MMVCLRKDSGEEIEVKGEEFMGLQQDECMEEVKVMEEGGGEQGKDKEKKRKIEREEEVKEGEEVQVEFGRDLEYRVQEN